MAQDFGFISSTPEEKPDVGFVEKGGLSLGNMKFNKIVPEATGLTAGLADVVGGAVSMPVSGIYGLGKAIAKGSVKEGAKGVQEAQEYLTPSNALKNAGVPEKYLTGADPSDMLGGMNSRQILEKIVSAPHEYLSKPISDAYFDKTGHSLTSALMQGGLDIGAYVASFGLAKGALGKTVKGRDATALREDLGYKPEGPKAVDTTKYNQKDLDLGFKTSGDMELPPDSQLAFDRPLMGGSKNGGGVLDPARRAELEAELNPATEHRVAGQGELFTDQRAYPEAFPGETRVDPLVASGRNREVAAREDAFSELPNTQVMGPDGVMRFERALTADELAYRPEEGMVRQDTIRPLVDDPAQTRPRSERAAEEQVAQGNEFLPRQGEQGAFKGDLGSSDLVSRPERGPVNPVDFAERSTSDFIRQQRLDHAEQLRAAEAAKQARTDALPWTGPGGRQRGAIGDFKSDKRFKEGEEITSSKGIKGIIERIFDTGSRPLYAKVKWENGNTSRVSFNELNKNLVERPLKEGEDQWYEVPGKAGIRIKGAMEEGDVTYTVYAQEKGSIVHADTFRSLEEAERFARYNANRLPKSSSDGMVVNYTHPPSDPFKGPGNKQRGAIGGDEPPKKNNVLPFGKIVKLEDLLKPDPKETQRIYNKIKEFYEAGKYQYLPGTRVQLVSVYGDGSPYGRFEIVGLDLKEKRNSSGLPGTENMFDYQVPGYRVKDLDHPEDTFVHVVGKDEIAKVFSGPSDPFKGPGSKQRGAISLFGKSVEKKGAVEAIKNFKHFWTEDTRPLQEVMKEKYPDLKPEDVKDLSPNQSLKDKFLSLFLIDKQMSILSQGKGPMSTIIKWVVDNQNNINRSLKMRIEESTRGALDPWRKLKKQSPQALRDMLSTWQSKIGKETLTETDFKTTKQWETYQQVKKVLTDLHDRTNEARAKNDPSGKVLKPIAMMKNYFPSVREGDFWIHIHDTSGNLKAAYAFKTIYEANRVYKVLKKDMGAEFDVKEPHLKRVSEHDLSSLDAYEETLQALHKDDPIAKAIQQRYSFLLGTRGFGRHALQRKGVEGALGFEEGKVGVKNAEKVLESYITRGESYIANLERAQLERQVGDLSETKYWKDAEGKLHQRATLFENAPIAKQWVDEYLARSKGKDLDLIKGARMLVDTLSNAAGFSKGSVPHFIQNVSSVASLFYLATVRNALVQLTQPLNAFAKFVDIEQTKGNGVLSSIGNSAHALFDGYLQAFNPDAVASKGKQWAIKNGYLESAIVGLIEGKLSNFKGEGAKIVGEAARWSLGKIEQHAVRTPVFYAFEKNLRDTIKDDQQRFQVAAGLTDNYMVHYDRESSPLMYDKLGSIVGESSRGLKTYAHNTWGQFFEYIDKAKNQNQVAPLATFLGVQAAVGGLRGVFLVAEATAFVTVINAMFSTNIPTPEQLMLKAGVSDRLLFGGASTLLGKDVSASVAAPTMPQLFNFVPLEFGYKAVKESWNYIRKLAGGIATDEDAMKAMLALAPAQMRGWIEYAFSKEGGYIPDPNDNMKGKYPVPSDTMGKIERFGLGFKDLDEARMNMIVRNAKKLSAHRLDQKLESVDSIVDHVEQGQQIPQWLLEKYIKEGGDFSRLPKIIQGRIQDRMLDYEGRIAKGKSIGPEKAKKLEEMKDMFDEELRQRIDEKRKSGFKKSAKDSEDASPTAFADDGALARNETERLRNIQRARAVQGVTYSEFEHIRKQYGEKSALDYLREIQRSEQETDIDTKMLNGGQRKIKKTS